MRIHVLFVSVDPGEFIRSCIEFEQSVLRLRDCACRKHVAQCRSRMGSTPLRPSRSLAVEDFILSLWVIEIAITGKAESVFLH